MRERERETDIKDGERNEPWKKLSFFVNREFANPLKLFVPLDDTVAAKSAFFGEIPYDGAFESNDFRSFPFDLNDRFLPRRASPQTLITNGNTIAIANRIQTLDFVDDDDHVEFDGEERRPRRPPHDLFHFHHHRVAKPKIGVEKDWDKVFDLENRDFRSTESDF